MVTLKHLWQGIFSKVSNTIVESLIRLGVWPGRSSRMSMIGVKSLVGLPRGCQARKLLFQFQSEEN